MTQFRISACLHAYYVLGDIADKRFRLLRSMLPCHGLPVCLFVCHVRALCSNDKRYRHFHNFFCIRQPHVSPRSY